MYGNDPTQQGGAAVGTATPAKKRSLKGLWITLGVIAGLLVVGGSAGAFALVQYTAPANAASQFCSDLKAQNYDIAYGMLSAKLQAAYSKDQFRTGNAALDVAEGKVTECGAASGSGSYDYTLGGSKATVKAKITRETQGDLTGNLQLVNESGWKIDSLDTGLLGINLGALQTLGAFCQAEATQDYKTAFGLLSSALQTQAGSADLFALDEQVQDGVDGKVTACAIKSIANGNTDTSATVTVTVTRSTLGAASGSITLDGTGGTWKISKIDQSVQGTNLVPLETGLTFCVYVGISDFSDAYNLLSAGVKQSNTLAQFQAAFTLPAGDTWQGCTPTISTYQVTASTAKFSGTLLFTVSGVQKEGKIDFTFVLEGGAWKIDSVKYSG
jgi:hypothetical protein